MLLPQQSEKNFNFHFISICNNRMWDLLDYFICSHHPNRLPEIFLKLNKLQDLFPQMFLIANTQDYLYQIPTSYICTQYVALQNVTKQKDHFYFNQKIPMMHNLYLSKTIKINTFFNYLQLHEHEIIYWFPVSFSTTKHEFDKSNQCGHVFFTIRSVTKTP